MSTQPHAHTDLERLWRLVGRLEVILGLHISAEDKVEKITNALGELNPTTPPADPPPWTVMEDGSVSFAAFGDDPGTCPTCGEKLVRRHDGSYEHDLVPQPGHPCYPAGGE